MNEFELSGQRVVFGTSEDMHRVPSGSARLVVTSPPYWNLKDYGSDGEIGASSYDIYLDRMRAVWREAYRVACDGAVMIVNVNNRRAEKRYVPIAFDIARTIPEWSFWDTMVWYIPNALPQPNHYRERLFDNKFEFLLVFVKGDADAYVCHKPRVPQKYASADPRAHKKNPRGRCLGNIIRIPAYRPPNVKEMGYHVAAYPEELAALLIETYTDPGDVVLDPFLGSGTTLKCCRVMERRGIGFELNREFEPLIRRRIAESWEVPDWRTIDLMHSTTMEPGMGAPRKIQFHRADESSSRAPDTLFQV